MIEAMKQLLQISRQMLHEIGREPTPEELAEKLAMPLERVRKVLEIAREPLSLDMPIGEEEDSLLVQRRGRARTRHPRHQWRRAGRGDRGSARQSRWADV